MVGYEPSPRLDILGALVGVSDNEGHGVASADDQFHLSAPVPPNDEGKSYRRRHRKPYLRLGELKSYSEYSGHGERELWLSIVDWKWNRQLLWHEQSSNHNRERPDYRNCGFPADWRTTVSVSA